MTREDVLNALDEWLLGEYDHGLNGDEDPSRIGFCYSQYEDDDVFVEEQWYMDLEGHRVWLEVDGEAGHDDAAVVWHYDTYAEMLYDLGTMTAEFLIGEADYYVKTHLTELAYLDPLAGHEGEDALERIEALKDIAQRAIDWIVEHASKDDLEPALRKIGLRESRIEEIVKEV